ncbi:F-box only protein 39-like [Nasonia vitripennis]|uniref:F-box domain-containing protein n=1 Tax=Nasonia vitripennis TaxID=7425 RepID=A0A7M7QSR3_NASVI|nr:F-box only protein 39-like [Nasonia vitripennis]
MHFYNNTKLDNADRTLQKETEETFVWSRLPELILTQVFSLLSREDRASAGQVCLHWNRCLDSACLWRRCSIYIDCDLSLDYSVASEMTLRYGEHMRVLELAWSKPYVTPRNTSRRQRYSRSKKNGACSAQVEAGVNFLELVLTKEAQLRELLLTNWLYSGKWGNCAKLLYGLANLLALNLEKLSLLDANLAQSDVLRLLAIVARLAGGRLETLDLRGAFREWQAPLNSARFLRLLGRFSSLAYLSFDYPALSDGALAALASGAAPSLRLLHVAVQESDSRQHRLSDNAWRELADVCPRLGVAYTIYLVLEVVNLSDHEDLCFLLLPSVPLARFRMYASHVWDQNRTRNFRGTVGLLIAHYTNTLEEVKLHLIYNKEKMDDLIVSLLTSCKQLENIHYEGILRDFETLRDVCQLQLDSKTRWYNKIHLKPQNANMHNRALIQDIGRQYNRKLLQRGVDFRIESFV